MDTVHWAKPILRSMQTSGLMRRFEVAVVIFSGFRSEILEFGDLRACVMILTEFKLFSGFLEFV